MTKEEKWILQQFRNGGWIQGPFLRRFIALFIGLSLIFWGIAFVFFLVEPNPTTKQQYDQGKLLFYIGLLISAVGIVTTVASTNCLIDVAKDDMKKQKNFLELMTERAEKAAERRILKQLADQKEEERQRLARERAGPDDDK